MRHRGVKTCIGGVCTFNLPAKVQRERFPIAMGRDLTGCRCIFDLLYAQAPLQQSDSACCHADQCLCCHSCSKKGCSNHSEGLQCPFAGIRSGVVQHDILPLEARVPKSLPALRVGHPDAAEFGSGWEMQVDQKLELESDPNKIKHVRKGRSILRECACGEGLSSGQRYQNGG